MWPALLVVAVGGVAVGAVAGFAVARHASWLRPVRTSSRSTGGSRLTSEPAERERSQEALLAAFRPEDVPEPEDALREDQRLLADALREIAKRRGAAAAVLWALDETIGGVAMPLASSADDARSAPSPASMPVVDEADRVHVEWSARERVPSFDDASPRPRLAVVPLDAAGLPGALSLHFSGQGSPTREAIREWLPEDAKTLQAWYALVRTRADVARQNFRLRALIRTAGTLQATRDPLELEHTLIADSLPVVGAEWAVLIRWDAGERRGTVRAATAGVLGPAAEWISLRVLPESIAGQVCDEGRAQVFADARALARNDDTIFGWRAPFPTLGSLLAMSLRRSEHDRAIGVLVCGHEAVGALRGMEARSARNLAVIAAGALETAWEVEDARRNARTDALTGLANRRGFDERAAQVWAETDRYGGTAALVLLDIDHFKQVNDTFGHEAGDALLGAIADVISTARRTVDLVARLGGEEMAILLPQTDATGAREVAERLRQRIEALRVHTRSGEVRVTASFGVGEYTARGGDSARVFDRADQALYAAKHNGRNRVEVAT